MTTDKTPAKTKAPEAAEDGYETADALGPGITLVQRADGRFYSPLSAGPAVDAVDE